MSKLRPAFSSTGTATAGNASPLNDGAAAVVMTTRCYAEENDLGILATVGASGQTAGPDTSLPDKPGRAISKALDKVGWTVEDLDFVEINEAFASIALYAAEEPGLSMEKVNVNGGAIALGHPSAPQAPELSSRPCTNYCAAAPANRLGHCAAAARAKPFCCRGDYTQFQCSSWMSGLIHGLGLDAGPILPDRCAVLAKWLASSTWRASVWRMPPPVGMAEWKE